MIWQEVVCNIVCLTNLKEGTKVKYRTHKILKIIINIIGALDTGQRNNLLTSAHTAMPLSNAWTEYDHSLSIYLNFDFL